MLIASDRFLKYDYFAMLAELEPLQQTLPLLRSIVHIGARSHHGSVPFEDVCQRVARNRKPFLRPRAEQSTQRT